MKTFSTFLIILFCVSPKIWAQKNTPQEKSIVNKEYDENGNLIQYDSTYVWQWNSDTTINFSFDDNFAFGKGFPEMFGEFDADSIFEQFGFLNDHHFPSFNNDEFFGQFLHSFPDSAFFKDFTFKQDSTFNFQFGPQFHGNFDFRELEELQKQLQEQFKQHSFRVPEFNSPKQQEEWEELMKKQQKEKEELMKKWKDTQSKKIY